MGDVTIPFAVLAALGVALAACGGVLTAAIAALWVENKALTKRILEREDMRTAKREVAIAQREFRREVEASEGGAPSVRPLAFDDKSEIIDVESRGDRAWLRSRTARADPAVDEAREVLRGARQGRPVDRLLKRADERDPSEWTPTGSDPPADGKPRAKPPSRGGSR